ncbi:molybdenum cofactor guanylyltransferase [Geminocystis sp. NIES-3709]|uniref:molybdenum cofactor guanylyltransferase n=1 Tax=Geminocystis sp. NIES-3709 TaxID=1617448 RepID=UPI0005FC4508|nr:molybdenum cofactor guanylyltransferase [Geminocystis sp. NIES-3709]BAQ64428.1 molybdopterin-guanine dinucleotide biosynthesis protein MobA [Geminocystis sp. NIES-3709]
MKITTVILAGGKSSRMGKDKALLDINGQPLLAKIYHIAQKCTDRVYVVTPWIEKYRSILPLQCNFISESSSFQGGLIAFSEALNYVKSDWILLLACDLPFLTVNELKKWINYLPNVNEKTMAILPKNNKGWECLCGFYRGNCQNSLLNSIERKNRSFQRWLETEIVEELKVENKQTLFNCNNPEDYQKLFIISSKDFGTDFSKSDSLDNSEKR